MNFTEAVEFAYRNPGKFIRTINRRHIVCFNHIDSYYGVCFNDNISQLRKYSIKTNERFNDRPTWNMVFWLTRCEWEGHIPVPVLVDRNAMLDHIETGGTATHDRS